MKPTKDNFSKQAGAYQKFRPIYPQELYDEILSHVSERQTAWDCGTGNGQVALVLSNYFQKTIATDISEQQLKKAPSKNNLTYRHCRAEQTGLPDHYFNLVTVAQAIHWFDFAPFFEEVKRVGKKGGLLAIWGYGLLRTVPEIDLLLDGFYKNEIGPYWDAERKHIDEHYTTIPFPLEEIKLEKQFSIEMEWERGQLEGYLNTWSSVQKFIAVNKQNPVDGLIEKIKILWPDGKVFRVTFPLFLRLGKIG